MLLSLYTYTYTYTLYIQATDPNRFFTTRWANYMSSFVQSVMGAVWGGRTNTHTPAHQSSNTDPDQHTQSTATQRNTPGEKDQYYHTSFESHSQTQSVSSQDGQTGDKASEHGQNKSYAGQTVNADSTHSQEYKQPL